MIKKIQILGLALVALCALSALMTATASAELTFELALWLLNGADVTGEVLVDSVGELLLKNVLNGADILCSGLFEGTVGPESTDLVTMFYDLSGRLIEELTGEGPLCTSDSVCDANSAEVWPIGLPWLTEVEQDVQDGTFWELTTSGGNGVPGYHIFCLVITIPFEELCEVTEPTEVELLNVAAGVEAFGKVNPNGSCGANASEGELEFQPGNLTSPVGGGTLAVSLP